MDHLAKLGEYTIASEPFAGTEVVRRLKWPGAFGLGHRYFYLLKKQVTDGSPRMRRRRSEIELIAPLAPSLRGPELRNQQSQVHLKLSLDSYCNLS